MLYLPNTCGIQRAQCLTARPIGFRDELLPIVKLEVRKLSDDSIIQYRCYLNVTAKRELRLLAWAEIPTASYMCSSRGFRKQHSMESCLAGGAC